ncbi:unnamed protein product [Clonostachys rosea f. rosea IK726]|uniref:Uncharacterized protein n=1 Tax=Clonostachys rosea f. rosea IK726 TaxID=1349383 RepID=A0ACA9TUL3_BIOOC|nr:unnamed protein product [Clonostachys rosea f. rosea IK726]
MTKKKKYPSTFYEWVVGTTIESALGPVPKKKKKPRRRGLLRVELSTDDESGEDTVKITYPRTQPNGDLPRREVKKVRFQEQVPLKSALKKRVQIVDPGSESEEASSASDSATEGSSSEAAYSAQSSTESPGTSSEGSTDVESTSEEGESTDSDYEPPPPRCESRKSNGGRRKLRRRRASLRKSRLAEISSDSESQDDSGSETNSWSKVKKKKLRKRVTKKEEPIPESDTETSVSSAESSSESEQEAKKKKKRIRKEKAKRQRAKKTSRSKKSSDESEEEDNKPERKKRSAKEEEVPKTAKPANADRSDKRSYPEANPVPHPRRPNYVAPVRAEVVQTERVIETPEDPPPNAFYDAEHNIIRVYQGPVYGGNPTRSLYPKRDSTKRPLPVGMPHPTQNPYYYGFNNLPPKKPEAGDFNNVPITQGMPPVNAWHAAYPPPAMGYENFNPALANLGAFNSRGAWHDSAELNAQKNALAKAGSGHNAGQASEKARQKKKVSFAKGPELTSHQNNNNRTSVFADWGKRISPPGSQQDAKEAEPSGGSNNGRTSWYHGNTDGAQSLAGSPPQTNTEPDPWSQNNDNNPQDGNADWGDTAAPEASGGADGGPSGWDAGTSGNDAWGSTEPAQEATFENNDNNNDGWGGGSNENEDNNVAPQGSAMPGSFPSTWGDTSAAADTNGMVDQGGWEDTQAEASTSAKW